MCVCVLLFGYNLIHMIFMAPRYGALVLQEQLTGAQAVGGRVKPGSYQGSVSKVHGEPMRSPSCAARGAAGRGELPAAS